MALVGASMGGAIAVVAAARLHPAAVVDLSGEPQWRPRAAVAEARR